MSPGPTSVPMLAGRSVFKFGLWTGRPGNARFAYATLSGVEEGKASPLETPFPYPSHANPTPHQIFHLPSNATQTQIKSRYYELVRAHHPDSAHAAALSASVAHSRFRSIKASYDFLSGRTISPHPNARPAPHKGGNFDPYVHELARRRRAYYATHGAYSAGAEGAYHRDGWKKTGWEDFGAPAGQRTDWNEDGWRERGILALGVITLLAGLFPSLPSTLAHAFLPMGIISSSPADTSLSTATSKSTGNSKHNTKSDPSTGTELPPGTQPAFNLPFIDLDRGHRAAVASLVQARTEREATAVERREGMKRRVLEMTATEASNDELHNIESPKLDLVRSVPDDATLPPQNRDIHAAVAQSTTSSSHITTKDNKAETSACSTTSPSSSTPATSNR